MSIEIKVPEMGESVIEATVARWLKQVGEPVKAGEAVVELETDKINLEVGAQQAGVLARIDRQPGDTVAVGDVLGFVENEAQPSEADLGGKPLETVMRQEGVPPAPPPTDAGPSTGGEQGNVTPADEKQINKELPESGGPAGAGAINVSPVARRMAEESGIDLNQVTPSSGGRITKQDVEAFIERSAQAKTPDSAPQPPPPATDTPLTKGHQQPQEAGGSTPYQGGQAAPSNAPGVTPQGAPQGAPQGVPQGAPQTVPASAPSSTYRQSAPPAAPADQPGTERIRMTRRRQTIARRMLEATQQTAMLTTFNEIDMSAVMDLRKRRREGFKERYGVDLGFMPFFIRAVVSGLKAFPYLNAEIQGEEIVLKHYYDIGIAVGSEEGLMVPVMRGADKLSFADMERTIRAYVEKVKTASLTLEDLRGGTFTITNGGVYGSLMSTPILNPPQVGILGMHKIQERPVVLKGEIVARPMMYVALSYDHRIVDGKEAVQFLVRVKEMVEDPEALLMG